MAYTIVDFAKTCSYLLDMKNDDSVPEEYGRFIINGCGNGYKIFQEFFNDIRNGSWDIVSKEQYIKLNEWIESRMKRLSLFDVHDQDTAWEYLYSYNQLKYGLDDIDFNNEFIMFWHSY